MNHLQQKRILLTRTAEQNQQTAKLVTSLGAIPVLFPCNQVQALPGVINKAWQDLQQPTKQTTDIIFSSRNGIEALANNVSGMANVLANYRVIAVGKKTASALEEHGIHPAWLPDHASQQGLIHDYPKHGLPKQAVFFRAETGSDDVLNFLAQKQVSVNLVKCYRTMLNDKAYPEVLRQLEENRIDAVLIGSARTADFYAQKVGDLDLANRPTIAVMSQQVTKAADKLKLNVQVVANQPSFKAMLQDLNDYFAKLKKG